MCSETAAAEVVYEEVTVTSLAGVQPGDKPERFEAMENASTEKFKKERAAHYNEFEAMQVRGNAIANTSRHLALEVDMGWGGRSTNGSWRQASSVTTTDAGWGWGFGKQQPLTQARVFRCRSTRRRPPREGAWR